MSVIPVVISAVALGLSIYGIFERRWATFSAMRVRIAELLAQIGDLNVEEASLREPSADDRGSSWYAVSYIGQKRTLLAYQAVALIERLRRQQRGLAGASLRLTASELAALAYALGQCGDAETARTYWDEAIATPLGATDTVTADNHQGLATLLLSTGDLDLGRRHFRSAVERYPHDETGRQRAFQVCLTWLGEELGLAPDAGDPQAAVDLAAQVASTMPEHIRLPALSELRRASTTTAFDGTQYVEVCLLDRTPSMANV
jgi:hypothetical protein